MRLNRFRLIELIILVTVLIGLFSLVVPILYNSRQKAQTTTCLSNLYGTIGNQLVTYTTDNDGFLPSWEDGWVKTVSKQGGFEPVDQQASPSGAWECPSQDSDSPQESVPSVDLWRGSHYGINVHLTSNTTRDNGDPVPLWTQANIRQIRSPGDKAIIGDSSGGNVFNLSGKDPTISGTNPKGMSTVLSLPPNPLPGIPYRRHQGGGVNMLFLDFGAETIYNYPEFMLGRGTPGFNFWHGEHWYPELGLPNPNAKEKTDETVTPDEATAPAPTEN